VFSRFVVNTIVTNDCTNYTTHDIKCAKNLVGGEHSLSCLGYLKMEKYFRGNSTKNTWCHGFNFSLFSQSRTWLVHFCVNAGQGFRAWDCVF